MTTSPSPRAVQPDWRVLLAALFLTVGLVAVLFQIVQLWKAQAPVMPTDIGARERIVTLAESLEKHSKNISIPLVQLFVTADQEKRIPLYSQIDQASAAAERDMKEFAEIADKMHDSGLYKILDDKRIRYREVFHAAVDELESSGAKVSLEQFWTPTRNALQALELSANQLANAERSKLQKLDEAARNYTAATQRFFILLAALIVLSIATGTTAVHLRRKAARKQAS